MGLYGLPAGIHGHDEVSESEAGSSGYYLWRPSRGVLCNGEAVLLRRVFHTRGIQARGQAKMASVKAQFGRVKFAGGRYMLRGGLSYLE